MTNFENEMEHKKAKLEIDHSRITTTDILAYIVPGGLTVMGVLAALTIIQYKHGLNTSVGNSILSLKDSTLFGSVILFIFTMILFYAIGVLINSYRAFILVPIYKWNILYDLLDIENKRNYILNIANEPVLYAQLSKDTKKKIIDKIKSLGIPIVEDEQSYRLIKENLHDVRSLISISLYNGPSCYLARQKRSNDITDARANVLIAVAISYCVYLISDCYMFYTSSLIVEVIWMIVAIVLFALSMRIVILIFVSQSRYHDNRNLILAYLLGLINVDSEKTRK